MRNGKPPVQSAAVIVAMLMVLAVASCDHGLTPVEPQGAGFGGKLTVISAFPPSDSLLDFRVVAFRNYPPKDILLELLSGNAVFSDTLSMTKKEQTYTLLNSGLKGAFSYVVVAQRYGPALDSNWHAVGVYTITGDVTKPSPIDLKGGIFVSGVDITIDFYNLPPQPF
jgi:hypothetical protein